MEIRDLHDIAGTLVKGGQGRDSNLIIDKRQKDLTPTTHITSPINTDGIRKLTPRECARLQGFPDTFRLPVADTHLYHQFGNSVTVNVIEAIAGVILNVLENHQQSEITMKGGEHNGKDTGNTESVPEAREDP